MVSFLKEIEAGNLFRNIVLSMPMSEKQSFQEHTAGDGYEIANLDEYNAAVELQRRNLVSGVKSMLDTGQIYLTQAGWSKVSLVEWQKVEDDALEGQRGGNYGSW